MADPIRTAKKSTFVVKQKQPYEFKVRYAEKRAIEFMLECEKRGLNYYVSVGGLDSITLLLFLRSIGINCPAISVSSLEDKSIQEVHKLLGVEAVKPAKSKVDVIKEFGYPIISKDVAGKIEALQNPTEKNKKERHAILTGELPDGRMSRYRKVPEKWLTLFGGTTEEGIALGYKAAPFKVSDKCCYHLKKKPSHDWAKAHNAVPYLGLMASEGWARGQSLMQNGCNYFGSKTTRSAPFAIFSQQDLLQLALDLNVPVPEIYGKIVRDADGTLRTTCAQRTGCSFCGFGIHMDERPHGFDLLKERNPAEWDFWINKQGWGKVLDYIGVEWR